MLKAAEHPARRVSKAKLPPTASATRHSTVPPVPRTLAWATAATPPCALGYAGLMREKHQAAAAAEHARLMSSP